MGVRHIVGVPGDYNLEFMQQLEDRLKTEPANPGAMLMHFLEQLVVVPLPREHAFRRLDNVVATPHLGYVSRDLYRVFLSADCRQYCRPAATGPRTSPPKRRTARVRCPSRVRLCVDQAVHSQALTQIIGKRSDARYKNNHPPNYPPKKRSAVIRSGE